MDAAFPPAKPPGAASQRAGTAILVAVAAAGAFLFVLGLFDQLRRLLAYRAAGLGYHDPACRVPFCDSSVFWLAGHLARRGATATIYNAPAFAAYGAATLPNHAGNFPFVYTPVTLLPAVLLSFAPLGLAYLGFTIATIAGYLALLRRAGLPWSPILLGLVSPAAMWSIYLGQFGLLCGALLLAGLAQLSRRPLTAGMLLGLLAIKPPYAFAAPFVVLAGRHWRAMLAGGLTLLILVGLSFGFGAAAWSGFLGPGRAAAQDLLVTPFQHGNPVRGVSLFWMLRSLGAPLVPALVLQACAAIGAARLLVHLWWAPAGTMAMADEPARLLATICLVLLASPYAYTDDMVALSAALPLLRRPAAPRANAVLAIVWLSPAGAGFYLRAFGFAPEPIFIAAALTVALSRLRLWRPAPAAEPPR